MRSISGTGMRFLAPQKHHWLVGVKERNSLPPTVPEVWNLKLGVRRASLPPKALEKECVCLMGLFGKSNVIVWMCFVSA